MSVAGRGLLAGCNWVLENSNIVVSGLTAVFVLYTRSAGVAYFTAGAVVCSRTAKLVKRLIREPRPLHPEPGRQKSSYGMPSTHSAVITYYALYTILASVNFPIHPSLPDSPWTRAIAPLMITPWAIAIATSRIWLGHHTWRQVLAGFTHGVVFTFIWYRIWIRGGNEYGKVLEQTYFPPR